MCRYRKHIFAAVKLAENYDQLKAAFKPVLVEINDIIERKEIMVCGQPVTLDIVYLQRC